MGLLSKIKNATNIGLSAQEQYNRAFEKGILLNPPDYSSASANFLQAAEKFQKMGNNEMYARSTANSLLYRLILTKDDRIISDLITELGKCSEIEQFGSQTDMMISSRLIMELDAIQNEASAERTENLAEKASKFNKASEYYMKLGMAPLEICERLGIQGPVDKAIMRSLYCGALADYYSAHIWVYESPERAQDMFYKSSVGFKQAQIHDWSVRVDACIDQVSAKRHCWICDREMQGRDMHFRYYPAATVGYHRQVVEMLKQDPGMLDHPGTLTVCTACGSIIEQQADAYAIKRTIDLRNWLEPILEATKNAIIEINRRVDRLESESRRH
jgi:hypothetical protein